MWSFRDDEILPTDHPRPLTGHCRRDHSLLRGTEQLKAKEGKVRNFPLIV